MKVIAATALALLSVLACSTPTAPAASGASDLAEQKHGTPDAHVVIDHLVMGEGHVCALVGDGTVRCWGGNRTEALCDPCDGINCQDTALGAGGWSSIERSIPNLEGVVALSAAASHTCAVIRDGSVRCWGGDESVLSTGTNSPTKSIAGLADVVEIETQFFRTCARLSDGNVRCWGGAVAPTADNFVPGWFGVTSIASSTPHITFDTAENIRVAQTGTVCVTASDGSVLCKTLSTGCSKFANFGSDNFALDAFQNASPIAVTRIGGRDLACGAVGAELRCLDRTGFRPSVISDPVKFAADDNGRVAMRDGLACFVRSGSVLCTAQGSGGFGAASAVAGIDDAVDVVMGAFEGSNACALRKDSSIVCFSVDAAGQASGVTAPLYLPVEGS